MRMLGVVDGADNIGFATGGGEDSKLAPVLDAFSAFRDKIRAAAVAGGDVKAAVLAACDDVRDNALVDLGVRLEDRPGKPSLWKLESPEALCAEQAEKAAAMAEAARKKLTNKLAEKAKEIAKWE